MSKLSEQDVAQFIERLDKRREELRWGLLDKLKDSGDKNYLELAGQVRDAGDESIADLLIDLSTSAIEREVDELKQIEEALRRIGSGTYDTCIECGGRISLERLDANPTAVRCKECQARLEDMHGGRDLTPSL